MSVLIKGMEMPKHCADCEWFQQRFPGGKYWCKRTGELVHETWASANLTPIPESCPLSPVPPHGRLIDADALLNLLNNCMFPSDMVTTRAVRMAMNWIKDAPTVIEAEEGT